MVHLGLGPFSWKLQKSGNIGLMKKKTKARRPWKGKGSEKRNRRRIGREGAGKHDRSVIEGKNQFSA